MLCVIRAKACQKCGGDLSLECDIYGVYIECIQCGANWTRRDVTLSILQQIQKARKAVKAPPAVAEKSSGASGNSKPA